MNANRREFIKATGIGVTGLYLESSFSWLRAATANDPSQGTLAEQITVICRRLAEHGWRALMLKVTGGQLDLSSPTLAKDLEKQLTKIDRAVPGFEDFAAEGTRPIQAGNPGRSLLFHALASANVVQDGSGNALGAFPTSAEIETVENGVYGLRPPSLDELRARAGDAPLAVVVFSTEYRSARNTVHRKHADVCFSRTATARTGNAPAIYDSRRRDFAPLDEQNKFLFRVLPTRFSAYVAMQKRGDKASFGPMRFKEGDDGDDAREFWVPLHKLFTGPECIRSLTLDLNFEAHFVNEKLRRLHTFMEQSGFGANSAPADRGQFPFVIRDARIAGFAPTADYGTGVIAPKPNPLFEKAMFNGKPLGFKVAHDFSSVNGNTWFSSLQIVPDSGDSIFKDTIAYNDGLNPTLGRPAPEYINARHKQLPDGGEENLNDSPDLMKILLEGNYQAQHFIDFTGDGWVDVTCPQLAKDLTTIVPAYVGIAPPDFFPAISQGELTDWWKRDAPEAIRKGVWCIPPIALSDKRMAPNITLTDRFKITDDTVTAIVSLPVAGEIAQRPFPSNDGDIIARLPDGSNGVFDPGWDFAQDSLNTITGAKLYLANYGLGTPFIEDAKLCAALGSYWPAVAPDSTRVFQPAKKPQGAFWPWPAIVPLTDEEIGSAEFEPGKFLPWDGVPGPMRVRAEEMAKYGLSGGNWMRYADIAHVDYIDLSGKLTAYLTSKIDLKEYEARILATDSAYWALGITDKKFFNPDNWKVGPEHADEFAEGDADSMAANRLQLAKAKWAVASFRKVSDKDPELRAACEKAQSADAGSDWYRLVIYRFDEKETVDPTNFRFLLIEMHDTVLFYVNRKTVLFQPEGKGWTKQAPFEMS
jgi:hypothetical protein